MTSEPNEKPAAETNDANQDSAPESSESTPDNASVPAAPEATETGAAPAEAVDAPAPDEGNDAGDSSEFAAMLDQQEAAPAPEPKAGKKVTGTIVQMDDTDAFVDCGFRNELPLALSELRDADGNLTHEVGQEITAHVQKFQDSFKLTLAVSGRDGGLEVLRQAEAAGTPVEGKVKDTNKGGFAVDLGGKRGFCPFSQIALHRVEDPSVFVGETLKFKILELSSDGRNIVLSRRALLESERQAKGAETRATLGLGAEMEGTVTRLVPFGAFVDIGGVEGLVHISQISHQRVSNPADVLQEGQEVRVKVMEIQNLGQGRSERISLSIKALADDPWPTSVAQLSPGTDVEGRVTRLVDFGVFVELMPGIEGLVHISELANRRIIHPREILNEGEEITVRIVDVDPGRRRISLSRRQAADYDGD